MVKGELTSVEMTSLTIEGIAVDDLRGIDCLVNLRTLRANNNDLGSNASSLDALQNLKRIQTIQLTNNGLAYLGGLAGLDTVENLHLSGNDIVAIDALALASTATKRLPTPIAVMKEREEARALRTDRGERLAVRRSPTRFRCAFFGPSQLHARRSGRCAGGGVAPIAPASGAKLRACQVRTAAAQIAPGGAKCDFSPSYAK